MSIPFRTSLLCLLLLAGFVGGCAKSGPQSPLASRGELDLRHWKLTETTPVPLAGEWEFYWQQLLEPGQFQDPSGDRLYRAVPEYWTRYEPAYPDRGFATYRLKIHMPAQSGSLGLLIPPQGTQYRLWLNGRVLSENGQVGRNPDQTVPARAETLEFFEADGGTLELVIQISNFHHRKAGFRNAITLGPASTMVSRQQVNSLFDAVLGGMGIIIGIYHLLLFAYRPAEASNFFFGLLSLFVAARLWFTNHGILTWLLPGLSWEWALRAEYLTFYFSLVLYATFMRSLYPREYPRWFMQLMWSAATVFSVVTLCTDTYFASLLIPPYQVLYLFYLGALAVMLCKVVLRRRDYWFYVATASVIVATGNVVEILYQRGLLSAGDASAPAFVGFLLVQAAMLSARFSRSFGQVEQLSRTLEQRNARLQESELKYRTIFEDSQDVIFLVGAKGQLDAVNPAVQSLLGYSPQQLMLPTAHGELARGLQRFVELIRSQQEIQGFTTSLKHRDGHLVPVMIYADVRRDEYGDFSGYQGYIRNITDKLQAERQRLRADQLEQAAALDPLTRVYNRGYFQSAAQREIGRVKRSGEPLALVLLDIDHFKSVNDNHGHLAGDEVLVEIGALLENQTRESDVVARYGGEEFVLLLTNTSVEQAITRSEELRQLVADRTFRADFETDIRITISLGVAGWRNGESLAQTLERADSALYESKHGGRNQVSLAA
ncbi:sensor domain-containing diguanylate cyclase [Parahaliea mediterranea]|uniref:diguanylate cyclase n=1 Tax=Parahaliea mediterranea TaxID=651086 RepID=A0A939DHW8_9GAMM|nr:diguanylate cyclase [Parahaliea mediterranea]MBN7798414.1 diguanylate cyclase [Parahaliea mediterranea]